MVRRSAFFLPMVSVSLALCLLSFTSSVHAAKPNQANPHAMGTQVDCRGGKNCASWLTVNFASKGALAAIAGNGLSIASMSRRLGRRSDRLAGPGREASDGGSTQPGDGGIVADNDNGHGNDLGHVDGSNPGNSSSNQNGANGERGNSNPPDDNGHGNDVGKTDSSNPGQGGGPAAGNGNGGGNSNGNGGGNDGQHDDNGHGNDPGRTDGSNPGKGK